MLPIMMVKHLLAAILFAAIVPSAADAADADRGRLLYATHCDGCHTEQVHWRAGKRVSTWEQLLAEVARWQANVGLRWSKSDIEAVARHLNRLHYRLPDPARISAAPHPRP